jgi:chromosome segregation ATPase
MADENFGGGFQLSGWAEYKERVRSDIGRIEDAIKNLERSVQDVRELISRRIDTFRAEELERLRREQQVERERAGKVAEELAGKLSELKSQMAAQISALQVKAGMWGALGAAIPVGIALIWQIVKH